MDLKEYLQNSFTDLELCPEAAKVYFCILQAEGKADASYIKKQIRHSNATTYRMLEKLIEKGFVLSSSNKKPATFTAVPLANLANKFEAKGRKFSHIANKLKELSTIEKAPEGTKLYTPDSLKDFYLEIPYKIDDFTWCVGSFNAVMDIVGLETEKDFIKIRSKRGCKSYSIVFDDSRYSRELAERDNLEKRETRFILQKNYPTAFGFLFGDTIMEFSKGNDGKVKILKIDSPQLARAKLIQNQVLWKAGSNLEEKSRI
jgi:sugar-specific transcriptional regulator TrmB